MNTVFILMMAVVPTDQGIQQSIATEAFASREMCEYVAHENRIEGADAPHWFCIPTEELVELRNFK